MLEQRANAIATHFRTTRSCHGARCYTRLSFSAQSRLVIAVLHVREITSVAIRSLLHDTCVGRAW